MAGSRPTCSPRTKLYVYANSGVPSARKPAPTPSGIALVVDDTGDASVVHVWPSALALADRTPSSGELEPVSPAKKTRRPPSAVTIATGLPADAYGPDATLVAADVAGGRNRGLDDLFLAAAGDLLAPEHVQHVVGRPGDTDLVDVAPGGVGDACTTRPRAAPVRSGWWSPSTARQPERQPRSVHVGARSKRGDRRITALSPKNRRYVAPVGRCVGQSRNTGGRPSRTGEDRLLEVLGGEPHVQLRAVLEVDRGFQAAHLERRPEHLLGERDADPAVRVDLRGELEAGVEQRVVVDDPRHQPDALGFLGVDVATREQDLECAATHR